MDSKSIADMRISYDLATLGDAEALIDPFAQFRLWWDEVAGSNTMEANAMALGTVSAEGVPQTRMVLMKEFDAAGLVFYTNYGSAKARDMGLNPNVCALFYWPTLQRQVRFTGVAEKVPAAESDAYFRIRPRGSQLGAWASDQSQTIRSAAELQARFEHYEQQFADTDEIPRPEAWGGFRIVPTRIEFWQGRENRLHDRIIYSQDEHGDWLHSRLAP
jgi:pyridoxamine 5'-phosphate oxidase